MAKFNTDAFSDEYKDDAPKECACFLVECLSDEEKDKLKEDWNKAGGYKAIPWWQWCLDNINVSYNKQHMCGKSPKRGMEKAKVTSEKTRNNGSNPSW